MDSKKACFQLEHGSRKGRRCVECQDSLIENTDFPDLFPKCVTGAGEITLQGGVKCGSLSGPWARCAYSEIVVASHSSRKEERGDCPGRLRPLVPVASPEHALWPAPVRCLLSAPPFFSTTTASTPVVICMW